MPFETQIEKRKRIKEEERKENTLFSNGNRNEVCVLEIRSQFECGVDKSNNFHEFGALWIVNTSISNASGTLVYTFLQFKLHVCLQKCTESIGAWKSFAFKHFLELHRLCSIFIQIVQNCADTHTQTTSGSMSIQSIENNTEMIIHTSSALALKIATHA